MNDFRFDVVVFDLDGTLADTALDLAASLNHALGALGRPIVPVESVRHLVGQGARALLQRGLATSGESSEALIDQGMPHFLGYYGEHICEGTRPYDGLETALDRIKSAGAKVAICTNKPERLTHLLIDALGWDGRFDAIVGADTIGIRKPDPAPLLAAIARAGGGRAVMIGDTMTDADTARAARVPFVAVSFGFSDVPANELGADAVIDHFDELIEVLERL